MKRARAGAWEEARARVGRVRRQHAALLAAALLAALAPGGVTAQKLKKGPTPIEVEVKPSPAAAGAQVAISGSSVKLQARKTVKLTVQPPSGQPVNLTAELDAQNRFSTSYTLGGAGTYRITATAPDDKATKHVTVKVLAPAAYTPNAASAVQRVFNRISAGTTSLRQYAAETPPSPAQQEFAEKLDALAEQVKQASAELKKFREGMAPLDALAQKHPEAMAELQPAYDAVGELAAEAERMEDELARRVKDLQTERTLCDDLDAVNEGLSAFSLAMSVTVSPLKTLMNVFVDKTLPDRILSKVPALSDSQDKFAASTAIKQAYAAADGLNAWIDGQVGFLNDLIQFGVQEYFGVYCEKFEGPVKALFHLEFFEGNEKWLAYDIQLEGMLFLRYEKGAGSGKGIPVTGEFEGNATGFSIWENLLVVESWARPYTVFRAAIPPVPDPYIAELGKLGRLAASKLPLGTHGFFVPVKGLLEGNKLALSFEEARQDHTAKAKVVYILMEPALPIPHVASLEFPYQSAHYILTRATRMEPVFEVTVDKANKVSRIQRTFTRDEEKAGSWLVKFRMEVQACNPGCP